MDVRIRERLIGALVLVGIIVLLVPAVLKGPRIASSPPADTEKKTVEVTIEGTAGTPENEVLVPEPEIGQAKPAVSATQSAVATASQVPQAAETEIREPPAVAAAPGSASPAAAEPTAWAVQLGAFSSRSKADGMVANLRARGYPAFVLEYRAGGQLLHRVRVGPEQDRARAAAIAERLRNDGFQTVVAPHP
jgi:DedD protein